MKARPRDPFDFPRMFPSLLWTCLLVSAQAQTRNTARQSDPCIGITDHPVRIYQGRVVDLSRAIRWYLNNPGLGPSYGSDSPLYQDWQRRKQAHDAEGTIWSRYLIPGSGRIAERRPEGLIIAGIPMTKVVQRGYRVVGGAHRQTAPNYETVSTTKEVLLKNAPHRLCLPIFAFPIGKATVGTVSLDAYDYGIPVRGAELRVSPGQGSRGNALDGTKPGEMSPRSSGSGFFITEDGYFVTNEHVVEGADWILLYTRTGHVSAQLIRSEKANDLAILKAEGKFSALPIVSSRLVKLGATVATVGFPNIILQGFEPKLAKGEIASLSGPKDNPRYFQISTPVQPGNSGGPLVDERGNVVGVVAAKLNQWVALEKSGLLPENVNYAIKSSYLLSFLESLPDVFSRLKKPNADESKFEDIVESAKQAAALVLVY